VSCTRPPGSATRSAAQSAQAGEYQVALSNGVTAALTATTRTGMADFTFPASTQANLIFKLDGSQRPDSATSFTVVSSTEVEGSATSGDFCRTGNAYTLYFDMQFSQPFTTSGSYSGSALRPGATSFSTRPSAAARPSTVPASSEENPDQPVYHGALPKQAAAMPAVTGPAGTYLTFNTTSNRTVLAKVGVSYVSNANAKTNLTAEDSGWNFASTESAAQSSWNALLGKVQVGGGTTAEQASFYTALYHSLLDPSVFSDDNGQYMGVDKKVHTVDSGHSAFYSNFSGWDIYRTQAQLEALIDPSAASDAAQSSTFERTPSGPPSSASIFPSITTAAFETEYSPMDCSPQMPASDAMWIMQPRRRAR
jgi:putative alpha-1,2-mannosidase